MNCSIAIVIKIKKITRGKKTIIKNATMTKEQILNTGIAELLNKYKKELLLILGFYTLNSEEVINGKNKKIRVAEFNPLGSQNVILSIIQKMIKKDKLKYFWLSFLSFVFSFPKHHL